MTRADHHYIEDENLSLAWARVAHRMMGRGHETEIAPLIVSITGFDSGVVREDDVIRTCLDDSLLDADQQDCNGVANTIFPESFWNPQAPRTALFDRYRRSLPRIKKASTKNRLGLYFERLIDGGPPKQPNQLEFIIGAYLERPSIRRSVLQVAIYDAKTDLTKAALRGFPCLQHVTFSPVDGGLNVNAFYATQYAFERAYGNYLGLCRLGRFVAHELDLTLTRVTCFTGIMLRDEVSASAVKRLTAAIEPSLQRMGRNARI